VTAALDGDEAASGDERGQGKGEPEPAALARAFPGWFERYLFAGVPSRLPAA
jgi:hypothetical protein